MSGPYSGCYFVVVETLPLVAKNVGSRLAPPTTFPPKCLLSQLLLLFFSLLPQQSGLSRVKDRCRAGWKRRETCPYIMLPKLLQVMGMDCQQAGNEEVGEGCGVG